MLRRQLFETLTVFSPRAAEEFNVEEKYTQSLGKD